MLVVVFGLCINCYTMFVFIHKEVLTPCACTLFFSNSRHLDNMLMSPTTFLCFLPCIFFLLLDERWLCPKCGRNYKRKAHLSFHLAKECGVGPQYNCPKCFKFFKRSSHLKSHQLSCGDVSPKFQCDICKKKFTRKDNMKTHKNTIHRLSDPNIPNEVYAFYSEWQIGDSD